ncbi:cytochrome c553 [Duganella sp. 1224]|uniref:c-type cytochrome n=1 Tax=Duganella sp. 1224 TaxID=2587052 RepID=UPI0015C6DA34|nr:c-type cytochrome [Duganella sp. 1224]NYE64083.1 cytochrome c553 [Duganella sp. 1224]
MFRTTLIAMLIAAPGLARAEPSIGARLAATCAACHGTAGDTRGSTLPRLAGQPRQTLLASLKAFKTGQREATIMTQIAKGYTDEQLDLLAAYFAAQPPGGAK